MWWLYLDESGDLGFDFVNAKPSKYFTICILATSHRATNMALKDAVRRTMRRKLNPMSKRKRIVEELKGVGTTLAVKKYAWRHVADAAFGIYAITLNKKRLYHRLTEDRDRVYNFVTRLVIDRLPFDRADGPVQLVVDRSKGAAAIRAFNDYIRRQLEGRIDPSLALDFAHEDSRAWPGLQWADLFAWGIRQKYEHKDTAWLDVFREKVRFEEQYL
jgi:hypothetical protein